MWKRLRQWLAPSTPARDEDGAPRIEPGLDAPPTPLAPDTATVPEGRDPLDASPLGEALPASADTELPLSDSANVSLPDTPVAEATGHEPPQTTMDLWLELDLPPEPATAGLDDWLDQPGERQTDHAQAPDRLEPGTAAPDAATAAEPAWHDGAAPPAPAGERAEPLLDADDAPPAWAESRLEPVLHSQLASDGAPAQAQPEEQAPQELRHGEQGHEAMAKAPEAAAMAPALAPASVAPEPEDAPVLVHVFATLRDPPAPRFACLAQHHLDAADPELAEHVAGLIQYVQGRHPAEMTQRRHALWRHLQRVRHLWRLSLMPGQLEALGQWAGEANAVIALPDGSVRDPKGYVLLAAPGGSDDGLARLPHPPDAWQRKLASEEQMLARGWRAPATLPPVAGAGEIEPRPAPVVVGRALALLLVAVRAESLAAGGGDTLTPERLRQKLPAAFAHLSPQEQAFVDSAAPDPAQIVAMGWRYEALHLLLWALGLQDELPWPDGLCEVSRCVSLLLEADADTLMQSATLRPGNEILDQLDLHLRLHGLLRHAELQGQARPAGLNRGVVMERHHALNWLIGFENAEWDKVGTPT